MSQRQHRIEITLPLDFLELCDSDMVSPKKVLCDFIASISEDKKRTGHGVAAHEGLHDSVQSVKAKAHVSWLCAEVNLDGTRSNEHIYRSASIIRNNIFKSKLAGTRTTMPLGTAISIVADGEEISRGADTVALTNVGFCFETFGAETNFASLDAPLFLRLLCCCFDLPSARRFSSPRREREWCAPS